jgi:hypothetical protein
MNYRGIALLTAAYKVLSIEINKRMVTWADKIVEDYHIGFIQGRSTTDHIFSNRKCWKRQMNIMWTCTTYSEILNRPMTAWMEKGY